MAALDFQTQTNTAADSHHDVLGQPMPARAFFFMVVDEVGRDGFLVRKVYASPHSPYLSNMGLAPLGHLSELYPERYGLAPKAWGSATNIAEHVMGNNASSFVSTSSIFPAGSPRFDGRSVFIDIAKARASGAKLVSTHEILISLQHYKAQHPHLAGRVQRIADYVESVDKEVLLHGERVPASAVFNQRSLRGVMAVGHAARAVQVVGIVLTAYDLGIAADQSFKAKSVKPIGAEVVRQAGGWGAAYAGFQLGGVAGAALGIETGPGAIITGLVGGIIGGAAGYFGADWVADHIHKN